MAKLTWRAAAVTDQGLTRSENQDNYLITGDQQLFVVADGIGGQTGGATASRLAVETMEKRWKEAMPDLGDAESIHDWFSESISLANSTIAQAAEVTPGCRNMGTTIVAAIQDDHGNLHVAHVGDSRAYLVRHGQSSILTKDHSVVMEMFHKGQLTMEQVKCNPYRHLITRCLGHDAEVEAEFTTVKLQREDWIILSSDGLSEVVEEPDINAIWKDVSAPQSACKKLLDKTLAGGAPDNVTIVVVSYAKEGATPLAQETAEAQV